MEVKTDLLRKESKESYVRTFSYAQKPLETWAPLRRGNLSRVDIVSFRMARLMDNRLPLEAVAPPPRAPWSSTTKSIPTSSAANAYSYVVANAGALPRDR
jgi:hypothetical protein